MSPAVEARARADRSHHAIVGELGELARRLETASRHYDGHVGSGEAIAQQSLMHDAATLRLVAAFTIRGVYNMPTARLWVDAARTTLARVSDAQRKGRRG